jgi:hypothetical protein
LLDLPDYGDKPSEIDIEGLDVDNGYVWLVASHSRKRKKVEEGKTPAQNRERLATVEADGNRYTLARVPLDQRQEPTRNAGSLSAARLAGDATGNLLTSALTADPHVGDAVALLSPALYEQFIFPADFRIAQCFENAIIHLHPSRFIPSRQLISTNLAAIELHIDHDGPRAERLEQHYRTILGSKPLLIWGDLTGADLDFIFSRLPYQGLAVNVVVSSPKEAQAIWDRVMS